jgi:hypothetical protein
LAYTSGQVAAARELTNSVADAVCSQVRATQAAIIARLNDHSAVVGDVARSWKDACDVTSTALNSAIVQVEAALQSSHPPTLLRTRISLEQAIGDALSAADQCAAVNPAFPAALRVDPRAELAQVIAIKLGTTASSASSPSPQTTAMHIASGDSSAAAATTTPTVGAGVGEEGASAAGSAASPTAAAETTSGSVGKRPRIIYSLPSDGGSSTHASSDDDERADEAMPAVATQSLQKSAPKAKKVVRGPAVVQTSGWANGRMPPEMWPNVHRFLDLRSMGRVALVCRHWRDHFDPKKWDVVEMPTPRLRIGPFSGQIKHYSRPQIMDVDFDHARINADGEVHTRISGVHGVWVLQGNVVLKNSRAKILEQVLLRQPRSLFLNGYGSVFVDAFRCGLPSSAAPDAPQQGVPLAPFGDGVLAALRKNERLKYLDLGPEPQLCCETARELGRTLGHHAQLECFTFGGCQTARGTSRSRDESAKIACELFSGLSVSRTIRGIQIRGT